MMAGKKATFRVGTSGYQYDHWRGVIYEEDLPKKDWLKRYAEQVKGTLFDSQELRRAIDDIYRYPLRQSAVDTLNRQLRSSVEDSVLAQLVITLRDEDRLCLVNEEGQAQEPRIICSLGLRASW